MCVCVCVCRKSEEYCKTVQITTLLRLSRIYIPTYIYMYISAAFNK